MISNSSSSPPAASASNGAPPRPPSFWHGQRLLNVALFSFFGIAFGLGVYTFLYAKGLSYFSNDPAACVNCHIMREQFEGWSHSSHKAFAGCNDCHTPHRFPDKWVIKGVNGWNHSLAFTTGNFPEPIMIRGFNANIAQENCVECHKTTVAEMHLFVSTEEQHCVNCHGNVGHDSAPFTRPVSPAAQETGFVPLERIADPSPIQNAATLPAAIPATLEVEDVK